MEVQSPWKAANRTSSYLPEDMHFNSAHVVAIASYSVLMMVSALGNITVLVLILLRRSHVRSRVNTMLMHLAIADLLVTFLMMPLEIAWSATVSWRAGDVMCRVMSFFRVFGLFLSSFVLICMSIDRYFAILHPMSLTDVFRRSRLMLGGAWVTSFFCSMPQTFVFHVENHPNVTWYEQCVVYHSFPNATYELLYVLFGMVMMYGIPLVVIIFSYGSILAEIVRRSRDSGDDVFRRSSLGFLSRARMRTLKMTVVIVAVFFVCWTPYYVMSAWYWYDRTSASAVDLRIQRMLFIFASTNSCMNPIVYGIFNIRPKRSGGQVRYHNTFSSTEQVVPSWTQTHSGRRVQLESDMSSQLEESPTALRRTNELQNNGSLRVNRYMENMQLTATNNSNARTISP